VKVLPNMYTTGDKSAISPNRGNPLRSRALVECDDDNRHRPGGAGGTARRRPRTPADPTAPCSNHGVGDGCRNTHGNNGFGDQPLAASIGRRRVVLILRDWLPFAVVLVVYDLSRGAADLIGTPTQWAWQPDVDRWMFFGAVPTVWLQEHLKMPTPPWWEVVVSTVYMSFFILPYMVAGALWLRDREIWKAFVRRFVGLSFAALAIYAVLPAAPPWAAARCQAADVSGGPADPPCMFRPGPAADGGLLGPVATLHDGARDFVERISTRGFNTLHLDVARALLDEGQASVNLVAAIPSLHAGLSVMIAAFLWSRMPRWWRPLLAGYVLIMAFTLVYSAEHYVVDILLGWALAAVVVLAIQRFERRRFGAWISAPKSGFPPVPPPIPSRVM
jgi:hypothetical protein